MPETTQGQVTAASSAIALAGLGVVLMATPGIASVWWWGGWGLYLAGCVTFLVSLIDMRRTKRAPNRAPLTREFERIRGLNRIVHAAPEDPTRRVLSVAARQPHPKPNATEEAIFRDAEERLRTLGWSVDGWPTSASDAEEDLSLSIEPQIVGHRVCLLVTNNGNSDEFVAHVVSVDGTDEPAAVPWSTKWDGSTDERRHILTGTSQAIELAELDPMGDLRDTGLYRPRRAGRIWCVDHNGNRRELWLSAPSIEALYKNEILLTVRTASVSTARHRVDIIRLGINCDVAMTPRVTLTSL